MRWFYVHRKEIFSCFALLVAFMIVVADPFTNTAFAASTEELLARGTGIRGFDDIIEPLGKALLANAKAIVSILIAASGIMVAFGLDDGRKTMWSVILGVGLALNFGSFIYAGFGNYFNEGINFNQETGAITFQNIEPSDAKNISEVEKGEEEAKQKAAGQNYTELMTPSNTPSTRNNYHFFSSFVNSYIDKVIKPGAKNIQGICIKLLLLISLIDSTIKISLDLTGGNLVKYMVSVALKTGFFIFLILNWVTAVNLPNSLAESLCNGFEELGLRAAGFTMEGDASILAYLSDNTVFSAFVLLAAFFGVLLGVGIFASPVVFFLGVGLLLVVVISLIWLSIEMFMAMIEFYTMALLTMMLLPFNASEHTKFLGHNAIAALFNCALKVCVIAFIASAALPSLGRYLDGMKTAILNLEVGNFLGLLIQMGVAGVVLLFLMHNIPALVQGALSGSPQMGAQQFVSTVGKGVGVVAQTAGLGLGGMAAAGGGFKGMKMSEIGSGLKSGISDMMHGKGSGALKGALNDAFGSVRDNAKAMGRGMTAAAKNGVQSYAYNSAPAQAFRKGFNAGSNPYNLSSNEKDMGAVGRSWSSGEAVNAKGATPEPLSYAEQRAGAIGRDPKGNPINSDGAVVNPSVGSIKPDPTTPPPSGSSTPPPSADPGPKPSDINAERNATVVTNVKEEVRHSGSGAVGSDTMTTNTNHVNTLDAETRSHQVTETESHNKTVNSTVQNNQTMSDAPNVMPIDTFRK